MHINFYVCISIFTPDKPEGQSVSCDANAEEDAIDYHHVELQNTKFIKKKKTKKQQKKTAGMIYTNNMIARIFLFLLLQNCKCL